MGRGALQFVVYCAKTRQFVFVVYFGEDAAERTDLDLSLGVNTILEHITIFFAI